MKLWVDADSCPRRVREIVSKAARNYGLICEFVANRQIGIEPSDWVRLTVTPTTDDAVDAHIRSSSAAGDIAVTRDIPLAAELVDRGVTVLNDRGTVFTSENVRERLSIRNAMLELRGAAAFDEPARSYGARDVKAFAEALDKTLRSHLK